MGGREEAVVSSGTGSSVLLPHTRLSRFRLLPSKKVARSKRVKPFSGKKKARFVPRERVIAFRLFSSATFSLKPIRVSKLKLSGIVNKLFRGLLLVGVGGGLSGSESPWKSCLMDLLENELLVVC